jgi:hypothetical protein
LAKPNDSAPFRARGLVYQGVRDFAALRIGGDAVSRLPQELAEHLSAPLLPSLEYDALPVVPVCRALAQLADRDEASYVMENARWQAERDLGALHKLFLEMVSPATAALKLPAASARYFNFGTGQSERTNQHTVRLVSEGVPPEMADWWVAACCGFSTVILSRTGAKRPTQDYESQRSDGKTVTISLIVRWE